MYVLGIDIGGTTIKASLVSRSGVVRNRKSIATRQGKAFLEGLFTLIDNIFKDALDKKVIGIGLGTPGLIGKEGNVKASYNIPYLNNLPLCSIIKDRYKLPTYIANDACNATRGEFLFGLGRKHSSMILLTLGTGVGGGIIIDNTLVEGRDNYAGELGHIKVVPEGARCNCGAYGCLEAYSSAKAIVSYVTEALESGISSALRAYNTKDIDVKLVGECAIKGDELSICVIERCAYYIGIVLSSLINALNIPLVVIGGGIANTGEILMRKIRDTVHDNVLGVLIDSYKISCAELGEDAGIVGSAAYVFMEQGV